MEITDYKILDKLAEGGMATVYLAEQESTDQEVALKVLSPELSADPSIAQQFLEEGKLVANLEHPNIIQLLDVGESNGHYYLSMELMGGGNLKARMRQGMTEEEMLKVISQIGRALIYAHKQGVLHLDVTPHNILFHTSGVAVLTDFGIAKQHSDEEQKKENKLVLGNPRYMSPEQIKGEKTDPRSDLYSLGVVMYEMLTGQVPFQADSAIKTARMHLYEQPPQLPEHYLKYQAIVDCLLEKIPDRRFSSVESFLSALNAFNARQAVSAGDKTIVFPVQKAIAVGGILSATGAVDHTMELDSEEVLNSAADNVNNKFPDRTDPMSVDEVLKGKKSTKSHDSIERALKRFEDYSFENDDLGLDAGVVENTGIEGNSRKRDVTEERQYDAAVISPPLVASREESVTHVGNGKSSGSDFFYYLSYRRDAVAKLIAFIVFALLASYVYVNWYAPKGNVDGPGTSQKEPSINKTETKLAVEEKLSEAIKPEEKFSTKGQTSDLKNNNNTIGQNPLQDKSEETAAPILHEDSGLVLSNGDYIINAGLERTLKDNIRNVKREADGSLEIYLDRSQLYQADNVDSNQQVLQLYKKLSYIFRNQKDFKVVVTDRTTHVDTPEGFRLSLNNAKNTADYFISYGLSANRIISRANSRQYQGGFNGIEISLKPDY